MRAAERLFTSRRFHEITLDEVARSARVSKGTIYLYFKDKDDLVFQIVTSGLDELCALLGREVAGRRDFRGLLVGACEEIGDFFERRRQLFRMMQAEDSRMPWCRGGTREHWQERRDRLIGVLARIVRQGQDEGALSPDTPADVLAGYLFGMLKTQSRHVEDGVRRLGGAEALVDLFCFGACGQAGARRRPSRCMGRLPAKARRGAHVARHRQ